ncbi:MAG TPA: serine hydrolase [Thermoanaerobaculia bacterium]|nr:serine hydrolase [Thermoanaerobaculia bacterium]
MNRSRALLALFLVLPVYVYAADTASLDAIASRFYKPGQPGASIIVVKDGKTLLRKGYGMADMELGVPIAPDMVFRIGSVTKQFTAVAILQLVQQGKIALDDDIAKFLPDYPKGSRKITIEHLLTHTSGIRSYTSMPNFLADIRRDFTVREMIDRFKSEPSDFGPGDKWLYNNSGYFLLGAILEKASGMTYEQYVEKHLFQPAGMTQTYYGSEARIIPRRVRGYDRDDSGGKGIRNAEYVGMSQPFSAGALVSTVDDLAKWDAALQRGTLVDPKLLARAWTEFRLDDGSATRYGYGWAVGDYEGLHFVEHGGGINGFASYALRLPNEKVFVAVLSNNTANEASPGYVATLLAGAAAGKALEPKKATLAPAELQKYVGVYKFDSGTTRTVTVEGDRIYSQRSGGPKGEIIPTGNGQFMFKDTFSTLTFTTAPDGKIEKVLFAGKSAAEERGTRTNEKPVERKKIAIDPATLARYVGRYELMPNFVITVTSEGGGLMTQATGQPKFPIFAESEEKFFLEVVDAQLTFFFGDDGKAINLVLHQGGRNMPGKKIE